MLESYLSDGQPQRSATGDQTQQRVRSTGIAVAVGSSYFLAGWLSISLMETTIYSFFWPAGGIASGVLIALGPGGRWPVATGVIVAEIALKALRFVGITNSLAITLLNTAEPLIVAGLIHHFCGVNFTLDRLRNVFALFAAAVLGCGVIAIGWAIVMRYTLALPILATWRDLFVNDSAGIVLVAPLAIGVVAAARQPPPLRELILLSQKVSHIVAGDVN